MICFSALLWPSLCLLAHYRIPMPVTELMVFPDCMGQPSFYVCPKCGVTMEREYMRFCDRCGQRLDWRGCENAKIVYPYAHNRSDL